MALRSLKAGYGDDYTISQAIYYAVDNGANIINMSFGSYGSSEMLVEAVNYAPKNIIIVAASGNSSENTLNYYPASIPEL